MRRFRHKRKKDCPSTHDGTPSICVGDMRAYLVRRLSLTPALPQSPSPSLTSFRASPSPAPTTFFFLPISYNTSSSLAPPEKIKLLSIRFCCCCCCCSIKKVLHFSSFLRLLLLLLPRRCSIFPFSLFWLFIFYQKGVRFSNFSFSCSSSKKLLDFPIFLVVFVPKRCSVFPFLLFLLVQVR